MIAGSARTNFTKDCGTAASWIGPLQTTSEEVLDAFSACRGARPRRTTAVNRVVLGTAIPIQLQSASIWLDDWRDKKLGGAPSLRASWRRCLGLEERRISAPPGAKTLNLSELISCAYHLILFEQSGALTVRVKTTIHSCRLAGYLYKRPFFQYTLPPQDIEVGRSSEHPLRYMRKSIQDCRAGVQFQTVSSPKRIGFGCINAAFQKLRGFALSRRKFWTSGYFRRCCLWCRALLDNAGRHSLLYQQYEEAKTSLPQPGKDGKERDFYRERD